MSKELDIKVSEALGIEWVPDTEEGSQFWPYSKPETLYVGIRIPDERAETGFRPFRPSTDWNDAIFAAEKAGIDDITVSAGPVGICNAILKYTLGESA